MKINFRRYESTVDFEIFLNDVSRDLLDYYFFSRSKMNPVVNNSVDRFCQQIGDFEISVKFALVFFDEKVVGRAASSIIGGIARFNRCLAHYRLLFLAFAFVWLGYSKSKLYDNFCNLQAYIDAKLPLEGLISR